MAKNRNNGADERDRQEKAGSGEEANSDLGELIHELEVHQVELGLQNEELRRTQKDLETSRNEYYALFDSAPVGFVIIGAKGIIRRFNRMAAEMLVKSGERLEGMAFARFVNPGDMHLYSSLRRSLGRHHKGAAELRMIGSHGLIYVRMEAIGYAKEGGEFSSWQFAITDITERKRAEEELRKSEERFHRLFEDDLTGHFLCTPEGQILLCNPAFATIFGFSSPDEVIGTSFLDLYVDRGERESMLESLKHQGKLWRFEAWRKRRDGELIYVVENIVGHFNDRGELFEMQGYVFDDTERKRAEEELRESEARLKRSQEIAKLGSWELDLANQRLTWSDEVYRIFGIQPQEFGATYETFLEAVHPDDRAAVDAAYSSSIREGRDTYEIEHRVVRKSTGEIRIVHERCEHIRDATGRIIRSIGMVHDITERKEMEEALRRSRDELELRVQERTVELEFRNKELQDFAFVASHDLQEPLRKVRTFGSMLAGKCGDSLDETSGDYLRRMQKAAARMQNLLNSLLAYSRVTTKVEPLRGTDLKKSVESALSNLEIMVKEKNASVQILDLPTIRADRVQMVQLFQNLIGNALKFNRNGEEPHIKIHAEKAEDCYEIYVEDDGIGFDERYLDKIFQPFQRLHGSSSEYEGVGMGLAICRKIVERRGGKITARSQLGKGSTFIVTLPANRKAQ